MLDLDRAAAPDDPLLAGVQPCHRIGGSAARQHRRRTTCRRRCSKLGEGFKGFLAFTDGADGVYWLDGGEVRHMPAFKVKAVDTLGAGDVFHAAFTFRLVETGDLDRRRCALPAPPRRIKCTRFGGLMGAATRAEVDEFLKRN